MQKFRKKVTGLVVEAAKIGEEDINTLANWAHAYVVEEKDALSHDILEALNVRTANGMERASHGMYVVKISGRLFVCQPGEFEEMYEPLEEESPDEFEEIGYMPDSGIHIFRDPRGSKQI